MSTLKVSTIKNASSATGGLSIAADGVVSGALPYPNRNLLYNGAMQVAQRGTSTTGITTSGYYTADRWQIGISSLGTWTQTVENDAPTGSGFQKSLKMLCTTADAAPAAGDFANIDQRLEGQDLQRIRKGTSSAEQVSLSFWVKSNVTGTYIANLIDADNTRHVSASYTISASATWEKKTIVFPADTTGAFDNDNAASLLVRWWFGSGTDRTSGTLRTSWTATTAADIAVGQTNLAAATNNYWQVTGVQLEVGDTATEFEHLPFGVELARCQRYYYRHKDGTGAVGQGTFYTTTSVMTTVHFPVTMRATPNLVASSGSGYFACYANGAAPQFNSFTIQSASSQASGLLSTTAASATVGHGGICYGRLSDSSVAFDSEL